MKKNITFIILLLSIGTAYSQKLNWLKSIGSGWGDVTSHIEYDKEGNVYISGYFSETVVYEGVVLEPVAGSDTYFGKFSKDGELIWLKSIGGQKAVEPSDMKVLEDGTIYMCGSFGGTVDFDPSNGVADVTSNGLNDAFLAKYTSAGKFEWVKNLGGVGIENDNRAHEMALSKHGYLFVTGHVSGDVHVKSGNKTISTTGYGLKDIFWAKYDWKGRLHQFKTYGGPGNDQANGIIISNSYDVYLAGSISLVANLGTYNSVPLLLTSNGLSDGFVAKFNLNGECDWAKNFGGVIDDRANSVSIHNNNQITITGYFIGDIDFDVNSLEGNHISNGLNDMFLAQYNQNGAYRWSNSFGSNLRDWGYLVRTDKSGNIYTTGYYTGNVDFNPSESETNVLEGKGGWDAYFAKYNNNGDYVWSFSVAGPKLDYGFDINKNKMGEIFIAGRFTDETTIQIPGGTSLVAVDYNDGFFGKLSVSPDKPTIQREGNTLYSSSSRNNQWRRNGEEIEGAIGDKFEADKNGHYDVVVKNDLGDEAISDEETIEFEINESTISIYPNPSNGAITVASPLLTDDSEVSIVILNGSGNQVFSGKLIDNNDQVSINNLQPGVHTLIFASDKEVVIKKVLVQ